ncbi:MAG: hypothetical protein JW749_02355 [Sedimentisphaerales bacterium]|nr:hypothetical protein [Sedimentisphaerales bacterium]
MTWNDNTKRIIFIVVAAILLLSVILPLIVERFKDQQAALSTGKAKVLWWTWRVIRFLIAPIATLWMALIFYSDWMRKKIDRIEQAARMKIIVWIIWWLNISILILLTLKYLIVLYLGSDRIVYATIKVALFSLCFGYFLFLSWQQLRYFRTHTLQRVVAAFLLEQHDIFVKKNDFDKAHSVLLKACETAPEGLWLWCRLALFCENNRKNSAEADKFMAKAEELTTTVKANSIGDKACYFDYLGLLNYARGERDKGLEFIKKAIDIESKPYRIKMYEELLADSKNSQSGKSS